MWTVIWSDSSLFDTSIVSRHYDNSSTSTARKIKNTHLFYKSNLISDIPMHSLLHLHLGFWQLTAKSVFAWSGTKITENTNISKTTKKVNDDRGVDRTTKSCLAGLGAVLPRSRVWNQSMDPSHVLVYGRDREGAEKYAVLSLNIYLGKSVWSR